MPASCCSPSTPTPRGRRCAGSPRAAARCSRISTGRSPGPTSSGRAQSRTACREPRRSRPAAPALPRSRDRALARHRRAPRRPRPRPGPDTTPRLATRLAGVDLPNPLGLAAGLDKNARVVAALGRAGFGFVEVGAATPHPQPGNPRPRLFRLSRDRAVINRFGFNNDGAAAIAARLAARPPGGIVGLNLGANKDSPDRAADFAEVLGVAGPFVDFATVNVSSPNTERLRELQGRAALAALLAGVMAANAGLARPVPVFLKIAPDLEDRALAELTEAALDGGVAGIVATNTTLARDRLTSRHAARPAASPDSRSSSPRPSCSPSSTR